MSTVHAVTDRAIDAIKQMIIDGSLAPGDRLPPEKELAERVGVSRNSLREAVKALSVIRVLDVRQGDGTYVTSLAPNLLVEALGFVLDLHQGSGEGDVLEVRRLLEPTAVEQACPHLSEQDFTRLEQLMVDLSEHSTVEDDLDAGGPGQRHRPGAGVEGADRGSRRGPDPVRAPADPGCAARRSRRPGPGPCRRPHRRGGELDPEGRRRGLRPGRWAADGAAWRGRTPQLRSSRRR